MPSASLTQFKLTMSTGDFPPRFFRLFLEMRRIGKWQRELCRQVF